jgi:hypothetical protein
MMVLQVQGGYQNSKSLFTTKLGQSSGFKTNPNAPTKSESYPYSCLASVQAPVILNCNVCLQLYDHQQRTNRHNLSVLNLTKDSNLSNVLKPLLILRL